MADELPPNATLYVRGLNEKTKIPTLITSLREIFSQTGEIIDVVAKANLKAKGQAFIVYDNVESATLAMEILQGFPLEGHPMRIAYAKTRSDATVEAQGSEEEFQAHKAQRLAAKEQKQAAEAAEELARKREAEEAESQRPAKIAKAVTAASAIPDEYNPPNSTLVLRGFPDSYGHDEILEMYKDYPGFKELRGVVHLQIFFVEFKDVESAIGPKEATNGKEIDGVTVRVTYQKA